MRHIIRVTSDKDNYIATLSNNPDYKGYGKTLNEAVGDLVVSFPHIFNLEAVYENYMKRKKKMTMFNMHQSLTTQQLQEMLNDINFLGYDPKIHYLTREQIIAELADRAAFPHLEFPFFDWCIKWVIGIVFVVGLIYLII